MVKLNKRFSNLTEILTYWTEKESIYNLLFQLNFSLTSGRWQYTFPRLWCGTFILNSRSGCCRQITVICTTQPFVCMHTIFSSSPILRLSCLHCKLKHLFRWYFRLYALSHRVNPANIVTFEKTLCQITQRSVRFSFQQKRELSLCALRNFLSRFANVNCCFLLFTTLPAVKCEDRVPQIAVNTQIEAHKRNFYFSLLIDQSSNQTYFLSTQANSLEARCYVF